MSRRTKTSAAKKHAALIEISNGEMKVLIKFFTTLDRWDREARQDCLQESKCASCPVHSCTCPAAIAVPGTTRTSVTKPYKG